MFRAPLTRTCLLVSCLVSPVAAAQDGAAAPAPVEAAAPVVEKKPAPVETKKLAEEAPAATGASATDKPAAPTAEVPKKAATEPDKSTEETPTVEAAADPVVAPTPKKPRPVKAPTAVEPNTPVKASETPKQVQLKAPVKAAESTKPVEPKAPSSSGSTVTAGGTAGGSVVVPAKATPSPDVPPSARPIPPGPGQVEERALAEAQRFFSGVLAGDARLITGRAGYPFTLETQTYNSPDALLPEWIRHLRAIRSDLLTLYGIEILTPEQMEEKYGKPPARLASLPYKGRNSYVAIANISGRAAIALLRDTPSGMLVMGFSD